MKQKEIITKSRKECHPMVEHPELMNVLTDFGIIIQKYNAGNLGASVGISKQAFQKNIDRKKKKEANNDK